MGQEIIDGLDAELFQPLRADRSDTLDKLAAIGQRELLLLLLGQPTTPCQLARLPVYYVSSKGRSI